MWKRQPVTFVVVVLLAACAWTAGCQKAKEEAATPPPAESGPPVKIEAYYPFNEDHQYIADYLREIAAAYPDDIGLEIIDFRKPEGRRRWQVTGLSCAGVFVNGSTRHQIERNGETETVDFIKRMDVFWSREDFESVLSQLLDREVRITQPEEQGAEVESEAKPETDPETNE